MKKDANGEIREHLRAHGTPSFALSAPARTRILARAREDRREAAGRGLALHRFPAVSLTAAAVAFLILSAGFLAEGPGRIPALPGIPDVTDGPVLLTEGGGQESDVWMDYKDGQVILTWKGNRGRPAAVRQGTRVQEAREARPLLVEGTLLVRKDVPAPNEAVFYVVE